MGNQVCTILTIAVAQRREDGNRCITFCVLWKISELDGTHTGAAVLYYGFDEQARHEHMSDEYKDRYIVRTLLKTSPRYYRQ